LEGHISFYGDGKSFITALITLNKDETEAHARANNIECKNFAGLTRKKEIRRLVDDMVGKTNSRISTSEQIKKYAILERDFLPQLDELTPTMKLKRNIIPEKFRSVSEAFYE
jgi:long-chain acyl-CoA synthetase